MATRSTGCGRAPRTLRSGICNGSGRSSARALILSAEIHLTEWSSSPSARDFTHDFPQSAAYIVKTNIEAAGLVDSLAYWTFTDVFEEHGGGDGAFHGGFGLINYQGIVKPAFHAYRFLNQLGEEEIFRHEGFLATRTKIERRLACGRRAIFQKSTRMRHRLPAPSRRPNEPWPRAHPAVLTLEIHHLAPNTAVLIEIADSDHGFALRKWQAMGSPSSPSPDQTSLLRDFAWNTDRQIVNVKRNGVLNVSLQLAPWAVALIREIEG